MNSDITIKKELRYLLDLSIENSEDICHLIEIPNLSKHLSYDQCLNLRKLFLKLYMDAIRKKIEPIFKKSNALINVLKNIAGIRGKKEVDFEDLDFLIEYTLK